LKRFSEINAELIGMREIEDILRLHGKNHKDFNLPTPSNFKPMQIFHAEKGKIQGEKNTIKFNVQQRIAFNKMMSAIKSKYRDNCFFLDIQEEVAKHSSTIY
jgi:hypothetical protein